jgi:hypothetical protein
MSQLSRREPTDQLGPAHLTIAFATDAHELIRLGILVDKGGTLGLGAGLGGGIAAAASGHWLIALGVAVVGMIAKTGAEEFKQHKFKQMQQKWAGVFAGLSDAQLDQLVREINQYYPAVIYALSDQMLGTIHTSRLLRR